MRTISAAALLALQAGRYSRRALVLFETPGGNAGFWDDGYDIVYGGNTYFALGGAMAITSFASGADFASRSVDVTISGIDPLVAGAVEAEQWHQRPVTVFEAIMAVDSPQILNIDPWFAGFVDQMIRTERIGGTSNLVAKCESIAREFGRKGARTRSDADQRQIDPADGFFKHAASTGNTPINWGTSQPPQQTPRSIFDKLFG